MKRIMRYVLAAIGIVLCSTMVSCNDSDESLGSATIIVTGFTPQTGLPGTEVTISGTNFGDGAKVFFNESEATDYVSRSGNSIVVRVPENAATGRIGIVNGTAFGFSEGEFTFIPSAIIEKYSEAKAPVGTTLTIYGRNFFDIDTKEITVRFGSAVAQIISVSSTEIVVVVPEGAESGNVTVQFGNIQTVTGPEFTVGKIVIQVPDYYFNLSQFEGGGGSFSAKENYIESTKRGAYLVYPFTVEADGNYEINLQATTNQGYACYVNVDMGTDIEELGKRSPNSDLSQTIEKLGWANMKDYTYGTFSLKAGQQYFMRIYFWAEGTSWVGNVTNVVLHYAEDQESQGINVDGSAGYNIYANDFNNGESLAPFSASWAWSPSYIKVVDKSLEFYFNQAALDADNRRERRGCEVTCDYKTNSEGWYGFKIYLPDGKFSKTLSGSIIAQIFNQGDANTWAGHLKIDKEKLVMAYRGSSAASAEIDKEVGTLTWNKWMPVVVYFRAGHNNKGNIKVWLGDNITETNPTFDSGNINFGFGEWIDDTHLNNVSRTGYTAAQLGCKFGLYVSSGGDRTIRFDDLKALEGNPNGAFNIVKP